MADNVLYYGDNLEILRLHVSDNSVNLIYLDPPFKSGQDYNVIFADDEGERSAAQIKAFEDTWHWDHEAATAWQTLVQGGGQLGEVMRAFEQMIGRNDMLAYLSMMAPRLQELHRVLRDGGSIYLHCDPTASHYLKLVMDAIFARGFQNEVIWSYRRWPSPSNHYQRMHDAILFYTKGSKGPSVFNIEYEPNSPSYEKRFGGKTQMLDPETKTRKITLEADSKGLPMRDVWEISIIAGFGNERLGYPTQKPEKLLERIIRTSSNPGDVVLDPFCGCGTAIAVAERLGRGWIGIDITHLAVNLIKFRLEQAFPGRPMPKVIGEPTTLDEAQVLANTDPYQFQWWALGQVGARPADRKKGRDKGIDGKITFFVQAGGKPETVVISVKAGATGPAHVRELRGVIEREQAAIGVLITMEPNTREMRAEAVKSGTYSFQGWNTQHEYPRLQLLTVAQLLDGHGIDMPPRQTATTFKRARPAREEEGKTINLFEWRRTQGEPEDLAMVAEDPALPYEPESDFDEMSFTE